MKASEAQFSNFQALDIRVGTIVRVEAFPKARNPAFKLWVDFGADVGVLQSSAQITELYDEQALIDRQVLGIVNFSSKQVADFMSECLVLGVYSEQGVVLLSVERPCENGDKLG
ncbi:MAG: tRNA-binding protein [Flavobacteriales bacterium]|nr:tRNA-binding protein [Flavobacteriales bacterium]